MKKKINKNILWNLINVLVIFPTIRGIRNYAKYPRIDCKEFWDDFFFSSNCEFLVTWNIEILLLLFFFFKGPNFKPWCRNICRKWKSISCGSKVLWEIEPHIMPFSHTNITPHHPLFTSHTTHLCTSNSSKYISIHKIKGTSK